MHGAPLSKDAVEVDDQDARQPGSSAGSLLA